MIFVSAYIQSTPYYHEGKNNVNFDSSLWQGVFDTTLHEKDLSSLSGLLCIILQQYMLLPNQVSNGTNNQHNHTSNHIIYLTQIQLNNKYQYIIICSNYKKINGNHYTLHQTACLACNGQCALLECGRSTFEPRSGHAKDYTIDNCCFSAKHAALKSKGKD